MTGTDPVALGEEVGKKLLADGGQQILEEVYSHAI
jgi:hypothetical protein